MSSADPPYLSYFGLAQPPFPDTAPAADAVAAAVAALRDGARAVVLDLPQPGAALERVVDALGDGFHCEPADAIDAGAPLTWLAERLGLSLQAAGHGTELAAARVALSGARRHWVLCFTSAATLPESTLAALAELWTARTADGAPLLQILVAGDARTAARLGLYLPSDEAPRHCRGEDLSPEGIARYVEQRLHHAGAQRQIFSAEALQRIAEVGGQRTDQIDRVCDQALDRAYLQSTPLVEPAQVRPLQRPPPPAAAREEPRNAAPWAPAVQSPPHGATPAPVTAAATASATPEPDLGDLSAIASRSVPPVAEHPHAPDDTPEALPPELHAEHIVPQRLVHHAPHPARRRRHWLGAGLGLVLLAAAGVALVRSGVLG